MKKTFNLLVLSFLVASVSFAQESTTSKPKTFGSREQYKTFSIGVNGGTLAPAVFTGGSNDFTNWDVNFGYGGFLRKQLTHSVSIQGSILFGDLEGNNSDAPGGVADNMKSFKTKIAYATDLRAVVNLASIDFLNRENAINFTASAGIGLMAYAPSYVDGLGVNHDWKGTAGVAVTGGDKKYFKETYFPIGLGVKFKITDGVALDLAHTLYFVDGDNVDANYKNKYDNRDKFSYSSLGLEFALGSKSKPNLTWANPVATLYDELKDNELKGEVSKLKNRTTTVEGNIQDLKKDTDGDGVADHLDKCPNTPTTVKVDGAGCPLNVPKQ